MEEREPHGTTIYNTTLYFGPDGSLLGKHRKLMPTGSERTVWGMGERFYLYSQGVDIWTAPTLAQGDGWIGTMRHIAREGRCYVIGVNPVQHVDQIPADFPHRERVWRLGEDDRQWVESGNSVIVDPSGAIVAGPARHEETILYADIDAAAVRSARRFFDPVGHYHRPDIFQLHVDTRPRPTVVVREAPPSDSAPTEPG